MLDEEEKKRFGEMGLYKFLELKFGTIGNSIILSGLHLSIVNSNNRGRDNK
jgi:hypothetical protein